MVDSHDVISQLCWAEGGPVVDLAGDGGGARHGHPYLADVGALGPAGLGQGALPMTAEVEAEPDEDGGQARLAGDGWVVAAAQAWRSQLPRTRSRTSLLSRLKVRARGWSTSDSFRATRRRASERCSRPWSRSPMERAGRCYSESMETMRRAR